MARKAERTPRFTDALPDADALARWGNWRLALEEEGVEGQDESTLMPDEEQDEIGYSTVLTAADATFRDGVRRVALLRGDFDIGGSVDEVTELHLHDGDALRHVELLYGWWYPKQREETIQYHDFGRLPVVVTSRLAGTGGELLRFVLMPDGRLLRGAASAPPYDVPRILAIGDVPGGRLFEPDVRVRLGEYDVDARGRRKRIGESWVLSRAGTEPGSAEVAGATKTKTYTATHRTVFTLATHELLEQDITFKGQRHHFTRDGSPGGIPPGLFGDGSMVVQSLPLAPGLRVAVPYLHVYGHVTMMVHEVLGTGEAPGHEGTPAWRVRSHGGGATETILWLAQDDRRMLASVVRDLGEDRDAHITIREG